MGIGVGIFLIAVGAVLAFAVDASVNGIDLQTVGVILMIVGALGLVLDLVIFAPRRRRVVDVEDDPPGTRGVGERDVYREERVRNMINHGLILLIIGLVAGVPALTTIGFILLLVGLVLNFVPIGGSSRRVW